jgi:hypothetical protein
MGLSTLANPNRHNIIHIHENVHGIESIVWNIPLLQTDYGGLLYIIMLVP